MMNSLTYLTRRCPRKCGYCALRDAKGIGPELTSHQWIKAFKILKNIGVNFNLILGNETWLLGVHLVDIMKSNQTPYALYTTCPEPFFSMYKLYYFVEGGIDNLSCGIDYPPPYEESRYTDDSWKKSKAAWEGFTWFKEHFPTLDSQGTITVHRGNFKLLPELVDKLSELGVFVGINFIHWNKDGNFDFFPSKKEIQDLLFQKEDLPVLKNILDSIVEKPGLLQNPEFIMQSPEMLTNMGWHCHGNPYSGPTIDSDGQLRVCGYRRGVRTPKFSIFDLPERIVEWQEAVRLDAMDCPGCAWSYPWMFHYWENVGGDMGKDVFVKHAGSHIDKEKWSKRNIEK